MTTSARAVDLQEYIEGLTADLKARPFGDYESFDACVMAHGDKDDPEAYCAAMKREIEGEAARSRKTGKKHALGIVQRSTQLQFRAEADLPKGTCGRVVGVALRYGVVDDYGTRFLRGALDRTRSEKVPAGRVALFANMAWDGSGMHSYSARTHVGTVRSMEDMGDDVMMMADIFDTEEGRALKEYLSAVMETGSMTGLSIGFRERVTSPGVVEINGRKEGIIDIKEVELMEVTVTPLAAVPGTQVLGVRTQSATKEVVVGLMRSLPSEERNQILQDMQATQGDAQPPDAAGLTPADRGSEPPDVASMEDRMMAYRSTFTGRST
ncbi:MAG: hypothetical protein UY40_C0013G0003 [candidate division CPR1 bacterium GW2011_GWC1_49_13]|uniref:Prohead serine protease domain-containing protein n=1 Tax=candidate division CPR1 bacterium GW2011_GWC1_49_13 TaxID=1618342 RepID=A0A0G1VHB1_9BACT|nr:MAG: hypothetical protein UY40_C0013G0003 [candidate division CPR1 bacterium GW2011_GWC1_49_13]